MKTVTEPGQSGSCCALGNLGCAIFCSRKAENPITLPGGPGWGMLTASVEINSAQVPGEPLLCRKQGKPSPPVFRAHTLTACACRGKHFSAPFRLYLFVILHLGRQGFSFILGRDANLTGCISNCPIGILLGVYWG